MEKPACVFNSLFLLLPSPPGPRPSPPSLAQPLLFSMCNLKLICTTGYLTGATDTESVLFLLNSHLALPGRHPGQLRRERRPDFRGRGPTAGAEGGPAPPPLACFLPEQRGCTSPVVSALLHACTACTHCGCPPSAEGRLRPRRETLCPPRSSWGRTPGLASRASGLLEGPSSHCRERGAGGQRPNVEAAQGPQAPRQSGLPELGGP